MTEIIKEQAIKERKDRVLTSISRMLTKAAGMTPDGLTTIYRARLPVVRQYEADTWYDQHGRIVFTPGKGLVVIRTSPNETLPNEQGNNTVVPRETQYHAPFVKPDRERDYRLVWEVLA